MSEAIKVVVRIRPMNQKEIDRGCTSVVKVDQQNNQISIFKLEEADNVKSFAFDNVFGEDSHQQTVYTKTAYNLVQNILTGYNGTIFAYGQTGCGKTHSMVGKVEDENLQGIIPRSFGHILKSISETTSKQFLIRCSFIEIYNEEVRDLLAKDVKNKLEIKESPDKGVFIKDLSINIAKTHEELMDYMNLGNKSRSVGETAMNKDSSRSHLLFCLYLESAETTTNEEERKYVASKLNLVDLAGSQRISKTGVSGDRLKEAQKINLSLSALGNVISALVDGKSQHIPYRDSKLTRLLQDSLGGNTKTVMIANCSPADYNFDETLSTLRYASRAKFIKNKPVINEDPKDALLKEYANQIKNLKKLIAQQNGSTDPGELKLCKNESETEINEKLREKQEELNNEKQQKRKLMERIKQLEDLHVEAKDIHMNTHVVENILKTRIEAEEYKSKQKLIKPFEDPLEEEVRQIEQLKTGQNFQAGSVNSEGNEKYKNVIKKLRSKVKALEQDVRDIQHENLMEKEQNLEDIRVLSKENKLLEGIIGVLVQAEELEAIKAQCVYNQDNDDYRIAPFYFKGRQLVFPKLPENQSLDMIRQMQENRHLNFEEKGSVAKEKDGLKDENTKPYVKALISLNSNQYSVKDIIKQARTEKIVSYPLKEQKKNNRKVQLEPIKKQA